MAGTETDVATITTSEDYKKQRKARGHYKPGTETLETQSTQIGVPFCVNIENIGSCQCMPRSNSSLLVMDKF